MSSSSGSMLKGLHHAALSVVDLDRSIEFYCGLLGMELVRQGNFGGELDTITALRGARGRGAMLRVGAQHLELFEFSNPPPASTGRSKPVCDHGISHFCIEVVDIERECRRLEALGVEFHCPPQPFGDMKATYARDPDGNVIELLELADPR